MYHDGMSVPRQEGSEGAGRVNQKRRTRHAIVEAARALIEEGTTPTVAQAAEAATVSRTTAYRYFPTQESLLLEVSVNLDVADIEDLVARPPDGLEHTVRVIRALNQHVLDEEVRYRMANRLYLDLWLSAVSAGEEAPVVREGRRRRWLTASLDGLLADLPPGTAERLVAALGLLAGAEAVIVLREVAELSGDDALDVTEWAARALIEATVRGR
jgi:AcrR family transcriptional regulator